MIYLISKAFNCKLLDRMLLPFAHPIAKQMYRNILADALRQDRGYNDSVSWKLTLVSTDNMRQYCYYPSGVFSAYEREKPNSFFVPVIGSNHDYKIGKLGYHIIDNHYARQAAARAKADVKARAAKAMENLKS